MADNYLNAVHTESLNCLEEIIKKCQKNNLTYYLSYGSLLGAIRHGGIIPWDDDIDIVMPRKDYQKFKELYREYFSDRYFLDDYECPAYLNCQPNCRVDFKNLLIRKNEGSREYNAFVSIFPLDGLPNNKIKRYFHIQRLLFLYGLLRISRSYRNNVDNIKNRGRFEKLMISLFKTIPLGKFISPQKVVSKYNIQRMKYSYENTKFCITYWNRVVFKSEWFHSSENKQFEHLICSIPNGWNNILKTLYGDYMALPPEEKRKPAHGVEYVIKDLK